MLNGYGSGYFYVTKSNVKTVLAILDKNPSDIVHSRIYVTNINVYVIKGLLACTTEVCFCYIDNWTNRLYVSLKYNNKYINKSLRLYSKLSLILIDKLMYNGKSTINILADKLNVSPKVIANLLGVKLEGTKDNLDKKNVTDNEANDLNKIENKKVTPKPLPMKMTYLGTDRKGFKLYGSKNYKVIRRPKDYGIEYERAEVYDVTRFIRMGNVNGKPFKIYRMLPLDYMDLSSEELTRRLQLYSRRVKHYEFIVKRPQYMSTEEQVILIAIKSQTDIPVKLGDKVECDYYIQGYLDLDKR